LAPFAGRFFVWRAPTLAAGIAMGVILPGLVFLTFRVAAVLADV
jgi:hypothetical protein